MTVIDQELWSLAEPAIRDALEKMASAAAEGKRIESYDSYPVVEMKEGEVFSAFKTQYQVPDFRKIFGWKKDSKQGHSPMKKSEGSRNSFHTLEVRPPTRLFLGLSVQSQVISWQKWLSSESGANSRSSRAPC